VRLFGLIFVGLDYNRSQLVLLLVVLVGIIYNYNLISINLVEYQEVEA